MASTQEACWGGKSPQVSETTKAAKRDASGLFQRVFTHPRPTAVIAKNSALDTLFRLNDNCAAAELGRHYGPRGLAAEPWPRTI